MTEPIFLVVPGREADGWDRRYTEFVFDEDESVGYFTSREAAEAWVTEQQAEGNAEYQKDLASYPKRLAAWGAANKAHEKKEDEVSARARLANVPYARKRYARRHPVKPLLSHYVKTEYDIWEVEPHGS